MTLRRSFRPLRPDLDQFLFAAVGEEIDGIPLSTIPPSPALALIRARRPVGFHRCPAGRRSSEVARLIAEIPGIFRPLGEAREIADRLVGLLPKHDDSRAATQEVQIHPRYSGPTLPRPWQFWLACFVLAAAVLVSAIVHGGFMFGIGIL